MNKEQLVNLVIIPTLKKIPKGYSTEAEMAIVMIIAHESLRGEYLKQMGNGPALGLINMEPDTHNCTWHNGDSIWDNALKMGIITQCDYVNKSHPKPERLNYDFMYNVFMARQRLFMKKEKLPSTELEMANYLKRHWNSIHGAATSNSYLNDYFSW